METIGRQDIYKKSVKKVLSRKGLRPEDVEIVSVEFDSERILSYDKETLSGKDRKKRLLKKCPEGTVAVAKYKAGQEYRPPIAFFAGSQRNWARGKAIVKKKSGLEGQAEQ